MKPLMIRFQAFGPYKNEEKIDFQKLSKQGLFLICGETGSGKTTILDAMTFALFGKSSGGMRDHLEAMRCKQSEWGTDTFVCYDFELHGKIYRFERRLECKKVKLSSLQNVYIKNEAEIFEPVFENCKEKDINAKAKELLGLDYEQFRQVIILPQGQFEKLLTSNSDEKEKILVSIFGVDKWQKIANKFYDFINEKRNELLQIKDEIKLRLRDEGCNSVEEFEKQITALSETLCQEKEAFENKKLDVLKASIEKNLELAKKYEEWKNLKMQLEMLEQEEVIFQQKEQRIKCAEMAEQIRPQMEALKEAQLNEKRRNEIYEKLKENLPILRGQAEQAEKNLAIHLEDSEKMEKYQTQIVRLEEREPYYSRYFELQKDLKMKEKRLEEAMKSAERAAQEVKNAEYHIKEAGDQYKKLREEHVLLSDAFLAGIIGNLASQLEMGNACPVCGSMEHPKKAPLPEQTVTEKDVKEKEAAMQQMFLIIQQRQDKLQKIYLQKEKQDKNVSALRNDFLIAQSERENAEKNLIKGISNIQELQQAILVRKNYIKAFQDKTEKLTKEVETKKQQQMNEQTKLEIALRESNDAKKQFVQVKSQWDDALQATIFEDIEEVKRAFLPSEQMQNMREAVANYYAKVSHLSAEWKKRGEELEGQPEPDRLKCETKLAEIVDEKEIYISKSTKLKLEISQKSEKMKKLHILHEKYDDSWARVEQDWALAKNLRGDTGIGLQRYVLGIMFSSVIAAANQMLEKVHGGRYRLFRSDEKGQGTNKKGLELKVFDSYSKENEGRSVKTLSGGEKFLVSLALSIGMSTVAQRSGAHLEAMFVDEGFGSLDQNSIEDALEILASIQKANGTVGIISHVQVLQDNIPTKLEIKKSKDGSRIVMNMG